MQCARTPFFILYSQYFYQTLFQYIFYKIIYTLPLKIILPLFTTAFPPWTAGRRGIMLSIIFPLAKNTAGSGRSPVPAVIVDKPSLTE
jgi:hypothetical protein